MNRITLGSLKATIARVLNTCTTDSRIPTYVNAAQLRLMNKGKWVGTMVTYRICVSTENCLVWPRQIDTIEGYALCESPLPIRNRWYQFASQGPGQLNTTDNWYNQLLDRDPVCAFDELGTDTTTKKIQVSTTVNEAVGAEILLQGYDQNSNWIRTQHNSIWVDGEYVSISNVPQLTTNYFTKLTGVQKPSTNGPIVLSEYETATSLVTKSIAWYESDETLPIYRASFIPGIQNTHGCSTCADCDTSDSDCDSNQVTVFAKLRHIDVVNDNDWLILGNPEAIKLMVMAIYKEEQNIFDQAAVYEARAVRLLQEELNTYEGDGAIPTINFEGADSWGAGVMPPSGLPWRYLY